ncbi:MAG: class I SAM-dependent methyltransferase [Minisyncoccia bacterium]
MADTIQTIVCAFCEGNHHRFFCRKDGFSLYRCVGCGHGVVWPLPSDVSEIYTKDYFTGAKSGFGYVDYDRDKEPMRTLLNQSIFQIESFLGVMHAPKKGKILDVGAATGFFLDIARERGWDVHGVEVSDFAASIARDKGIAMTTGTLADLQDAQESFVAVTLWDVIEHVQNPLEELRRAAGLLAPGGVLLMTTPGLSSLYARFLGKRWHLIVPPEHLHYFTRRSMRLLLKKAGLEVLDISGPSKSFTLSYIFQTLARWQGPLVWGKVAQFLKNRPMIGGLSIPVPLRDNMLVLARKI